MINRKLSLMDFFVQNPVVLQCHWRLIIDSFNMNPAFRNSSITLGVMGTKCLCRLVSPIRIVQNLPGFRTRKHIGTPQNQVAEEGRWTVSLFLFFFFSKIQVVILSPTFSKYPEPLETPHRNQAGPSSDVQVSFPTPPYNISPCR